MRLATSVRLSMLSLLLWWFLLLVPLGSGQDLPVFSDIPPPAYMVDQEGNTFGTAPDHETRNGPVLSESNATSGSIHTFTLLAETAQAQTSYWLANMEHGQVSFLHPKYSFSQDRTRILIPS
jgi:hypothetical protein